MSTRSKSRTKTSCHNNDNNNEKARMKLKHISLMNELLFSNSDFFTGFTKRKSQTPNKMCVRNAKSPQSFYSKESNKNNSNNNHLYPKSTKNSKELGFFNKKSMNQHKSSKPSSLINKQKKLTNNILTRQKDKILREMNTSPLLRNKKFTNKSHTMNNSGNLSATNLMTNIKNKKNNKEKNSKCLSHKISPNQSKIDVSKSCAIEKAHNKGNEEEIKILAEGLKQKKLIKSSSLPIFHKKPKVVKKIFKIETLSQVGFSGPGVIKYNQDNFFIYKNLNDEPDTLYLGVCDGHGIVGHDVSSYLIKHLPSNLNTELKKTNKYIKDKDTLYKTLSQVFVNTNKSLCHVQSIDTKFSGSTCVTLILTKNKIISANAGDSRAVMGRFKDGVWTNIDLSRDHKPNDKEESERIISHGGRIEAYKDENGGDLGPPRVWLKNEDIPGLAMSRSFGDEVAASVGTISEPEIKSFDITEDDKFIIIASDGIWDFISSLECVNIIKDYYEKKDLKGCLKYLLNESSKRWIKEEEVIDDITAILVFFEE